MRIAAITQSYDEPLFLPIWVHHYGRLIGPENLFIIDDSPKRDIADRYTGLNVLRKPEGKFHENERALYVSLFHKALLQRYDAALYTDTDELLAPDPAYAKSLGEIVASEPKLPLAAAGFDVLHNHLAEPAIDPARPLFAQRRYMQFQRAYCKPTISRRVMQWNSGFHIANGETKFCPRLLLFHLRAVDLDGARARHRSYSAVEFSRDTIEQRQSVQMRWESDKYIRSYFPTRNLDLAGCRDEIDVENLYSTTELVEAYASEETNLFRVPARFADAVELSGKSVAFPDRPSATDWAGIVFEDCYWRAVAAYWKGSRNAPCPCGSGNRIKHCHGSLAPRTR